MRILHILDHSIPLQSGYTFRTLAILREQRHLGWETFQLTSPKHTAGGGAVEETVDGWHFFRTPAVPPSKIPLPSRAEWAVVAALERRLHAVVERVRPDVLHAHSPVLNAIPAIRVGKRLGIPVVYEVRAFWEDAAVDHGTTTHGSLRYRAGRWLETRAFQAVDHVFTICEGLRHDIVGRGVAAQKVSLIPNAVDVDAFSVGGAPDADLRRRLGLEGCIVVGFIGSFYAYEGLDLLLDAMPGIVAARPEVRVLLVGGGPQDEALRARAAALGIGERVVFTGRVPHADVPRFYDQIDVLAYPRHSMRLTELVTPLKPLEAMAQGRVLIASDVGGHRELIRDGETGVLFEAGSAASLTGRLLHLIDDRSAWPGLRARGRAFVEEQRNWRLSVAGYAPVYSRLGAQVDTGVVRRAHAN